MCVHGSGRNAATIGIASPTTMSTMNGRDRRPRGADRRQHRIGRPTNAAASSRANVPSGYQLV